MLGYKNTDFLLGKQVSVLVGIHAREVFHIHMCTLVPAGMEALQYKPELPKGATKVFTKGQKSHRECRYFVFRPPGGALGPFHWGSSFLSYGLRCSTRPSHRAFATSLKILFLGRWKRTKLFYRFTEKPPRCLFFPTPPIPIT